MPCGAPWRFSGAWPSAMPRCRQSGRIEYRSASTWATSHRRLPTSSAMASTWRRGWKRLAEPGGIWVSRAVHEQVRDKLAFGFEDMVLQALSVTSGAGRPGTSSPERHRHGQAGPIGKADADEAASVRAPARPALVRTAEPRQLAVPSERHRVRRIHPELEQIAAAGGHDRSVAARVADPHRRPCPGPSKHSNGVRANCPRRGTHSFARRPRTARIEMWPSG